MFHDPRMSFPNFHETRLGQGVVPVQHTFFEGIMASIYILKKKAKKKPRKLKKHFKQFFEVERNYFIFFCY